MSTKPKILVFIDWFWPGYLAGGPVQSILSLVNYLGSEIDFKIITTNCDLNSSKAYEGITPDVWTHSPLGCEVYYADPAKLNYSSLKKIIDSTAFDKTYINSFFSKNFSILPLQILNAHYKNKPLILAPRGMLGEGALAIKSLKKKLFIVYAKLTRLHAGVTWHATSEQEEQEIKKVIRPKNAIVRISNLPKKLQANPGKIKMPASLNLFFMSRISEKKNLLFALEILAQIKNGNVCYNIYGPLEDQAYWQKCEAVIKILPENIQVKYKGSISPETLESALANEHVLLLPTHNENFGHAIVESLLCGCPSIISDQTPWTDLEASKAGYAIPLNDKQAYIKAISEYLSLDQAAFSDRSRQAINYIRKKIDLDLISSQYKTLFNA